MYRKLLAILSFLILAGCAKNFDMSKMTSELPGPAVYKDPRTVEEIEALKPQLKFPTKLAVAQPLNEGWLAREDWSPEELNIIESWGAALKEAGFASELVVLPKAFLGDCESNKSYNHCKVEQNRKVAAQFRADALLVISTVNEVDTYPNVLGVLDFTIIGCYIVPAHHVNSLTVLEGALIDNRNEYLYAFQRSHSEVRNISPFAYADSGKATKESREAALRVFGEKMIAEVKKYSESKPR